MSDALLGALIGGASALLGGIVVQILINWREEGKAKQGRLREVRVRLVGEPIQTSEVIDFIRLQRKRKWPCFWEREKPDLKGAILAGTTMPDGSKHE